MVRTGGAERSNRRANVEHTGLWSDVVTSGGSAITAIEAIREEGGEVIGLLALVDRAAGGREKIEAIGVPVVALVSASELGIGA